MAEWFFPILGGGEEQGLNDAGVETFKKRDSLARETLQNIGDVWNRKSGEPAIATFELVNLPAQEFPGRDELIEIFEACKRYVLEGLPDGTGNEEKFFNEALKVLQGENISLLRIGDENTSGLTGGDNDRREPFFRLLKGQGSSSLQGDGGGTYGIGQRAPFAHSALRTVLYSTRTPDGVAFIAKSILASFPHPCHGQMTQSKGWWCKANEAKDRWSTLRDPDDIPDRFLRKEVGTDLWIAGFRAEDWEQSVRHSALRHFFAAIENDQLIVQTENDGEITTRIDSSNLEKELIKASDEARHVQSSKEYKEGLGSSLYFHKAITSPYGGKPFVKNISPLGDVKLYIYRDTNNKDIPDRWATMRKPRIIVEHFGSGILSRFAAVLICDNQEGNEYLAELEGPEHNQWHEEQTRQWTPREKAEAREALTQVRRFVRETLKKVRGANMTDQQDIPFLGRYLPAEEEVNDESISGAASTPTGKASDDESGVLQSKLKKEKVRGVAHKIERTRIEARNQKNSAGDDVMPGVHPGSGHGSESGEGPRPGTELGPGGDDQVRLLLPEDVRFRAFRSRDGYRIVLEAEKELSGRLKLRAVGETGKFAVDLLEAQDEEDNRLLKIEPSAIDGVCLKPGRKKVLRVQINSESDLVLAIGD